MSSKTPETKRGLPPDEIAALADGIKSYTIDGDTTDFDAGEFQAHVISPEFRKKILAEKLPDVDPESLQDTVPPGRGKTPPVAPHSPQSVQGGSPASSGLDVTSPSRRRAASRAQQKQNEERRRVALVIGAVLLLGLLAGWGTWQVLLKTPENGDAGSRASAAPSLPSAAAAGRTAATTREPEHVHPSRDAVQSNSAAARQSVSHNAPPSPSTQPKSTTNTRSSHSPAQTRDLQPDISATLPAESDTTELPAKSEPNTEPPRETAPPLQTSNSPVPSSALGPAAPAHTAEPPSKPKKQVWTKSR
jgi:hypothetical protein